MGIAVRMLGTDPGLWTRAGCGQAPPLTPQGSNPDPSTPGAQSLGLLDPKLCYLLDGVLFIYGVIITALFLRAKAGGGGAQAPRAGPAPGLTRPVPGRLPERTRLRSAGPAAPLGAPRGPGRRAQRPRRSSRLLQELNLRGREEYEALDKRRGLDPEMGGKQRKRNPQEVVYNALQKDKMAEAYSEIGIKSENQRRRGKGHDGLYQGLSTATKDTYDALHMQALPPR
nr:T-cell surface glycoprotein CD3 zeta chain [Vulpes vulpes]